MKPAIIILLAALACAGCGTTAKQSNYDSTKRPPTTHVDIIREGNLPDRGYTEVSELLAVGFGDEEFKVREVFVKKAKAMGADAIMIGATRNIGYHLNLFGRSDTQFQYKAIAIVYKTP